MTQAEKIHESARVLREVLTDAHADSMTTTWGALTLHVTAARARLLTPNGPCEIPFEGEPSPELVALLDGPGESA